MAASLLFKRAVEVARTGEAGAKFAKNERRRTG